MQNNTSPQSLTDDQVMEMADAHNDSCLDYGAYASYNDPQPRLEYNNEEERHVNTCTIKGHCDDCYAYMGGDPTPPPAFTGERALDTAMKPADKQKAAVQEELADRILARLTKLGACEETSMRQRFASIIRTHQGAFGKSQSTTRISREVYNTTVQRLAIQGKIRRLQATDGPRYIALAEAPKGHFSKGVWLHRDAVDNASETFNSRRHRYEAKMERYFVYASGQQEPTQYAGKMPLTDDAIQPHMDETYIGEKAEEETFGNSYEDKVQAEYLDAILPADSEAPETARLINRSFVKTKRLPLKQQIRNLRRIKQQEASGQGARNTKRAQKRYFAQPDKLEESKLHYAAQQILAREKAAFHQADDATPEGSEENAA